MLSIDNLCAGYGVATVLHEVSLKIAARESVAIIGANGAGKSTLVRAICGLLPLSAGAITKDGQDFYTLPAHERPLRGVAAVLEGRHLFGEMTVEANLRLALDHGRQRAETKFDISFDEVLDLFPFMRGRRNARVELLSGGEQQMVAIGRALLLKPDVLILDEPSTGLAPKVVRDIVKVIASLRGRGLSLLLIEQNVAIAAENSDRAYVLSLGRIVRHIAGEEWTGGSATESLTEAYLGKH